MILPSYQPKRCVKFSSSMLMIFPKPENTLNLQGFLKRLETIHTLKKFAAGFYYQNSTPKARVLSPESTAKLSNMTIIIVKIDNCLRRMIQYS